MPIPSGVETVTVTDGGVPLTLPDGTLMQGYLTITAPALATVPAADYLFGGHIRRQVTDGRFGDIVLVAMDATGLTVTGWTYAVEATIRNGADWTRYISLSKDTPSVVLADILAPDPATPGYTGALPSSTVTSETTYGQPASPGSTLLYSRGDHTHGTPAALTPASTVAPETSSGQQPAVGTSAAYAREDHTHGTPAAIASSGTVASETAYGQSASAGAAATYARGDHTHGTPGLADGAPTTSAVGDAASAGTGTAPARADHTHGREAFGIVASQTSYGAAAADGTASTVARSDHVHGTPVLTGSAPAVTEAIGTAASVGTASSPARADHVHPMAAAGTPGSSAVGDTASAGTATAFAAGDHRHGREAFGSVTSQTSYGAAAADGTASTVARSDHTHGTPALTSSAPASSAVGDTATVGTASAPSRADHRHGREGFGSVAAQTSYGASSADGTAPTVAHSDHTHGTPALTSSAPATTEAIGTAAATGTATAPARADHVHPMAAAGTPGSSAVGDTASTGAATTFAASDHRHGREAFGAVTAQTAFGAASSSGSASTVARSDHTHGTPSLPSIQIAAPTGNATTDLASVNAALAAQNGQPAKLQLQEGTYVLPAPASPSSGCISLGVNGTVLCGRGMGATTLKLAGGSSDVTGIIRTPSGVQNSKITFQDFSIDGNAAGQTGSPTVIGAFCGVTPNSTLTDTDVTFDHIEIYGCTGYGLDPHERTTRLVIDSCLFHDNGTDGAHDGCTIDGCYDFTVINSKAWNNGRHGFNFVTASTRGQVINCEAYGNGGNGFTLQNGAKYLDFANCHAYNNAAANWVINGVAQTGQQDNTPGGLHGFTNCRSTLAGQHGFQLVGASNSRFVGCHSQDAGQAANATYDHFRIAETGANYSQNNTLIGCTWGQTSGVTNAAKWGIEEQSSNDGPSFVIGCSGSGTTNGSLNLLNGTSALAAAHNGSSGGHPSEFFYAFDSPARHGLKEWNYPLDMTGGGTGVALTPGTVYGGRLDIQSGQTISALSVVCGTPATGLTSGQCVAVVYDCTTSTAQELARTGDISGLFSATGPVDLALTGTFTPSAGQKVCWELLFNGATPPQLIRSGATGVSAPNLGQSSTSPRRYFTNGTLQTSLPSSFALSGTTSANALTIFVGMK